MIRDSHYYHVLQLLKETVFQVSPQDHIAESPLVGLQYNGREILHLFPVLQTVQRLLLSVQVWNHSLCFWPETWSFSPLPMIMNQRSLEVLSEGKILKKITRKNIKQWPLPNWSLPMGMIFFILFFKYNEWFEPRIPLKPDLWKSWMQGKTYKKKIRQEYKTMNPAK